ncbi:hypothetical protein Tco_0948202 [Tanacetum coccineum]
MRMATKGASQGRCPAFACCESFMIRICLWEGFALSAVAYVACTIVDILGRTLYWSCHCSLLPPVGVATVAPPSPTKPKKGKAALPLKSDRVWLKSFV